MFFFFYGPFAATEVKFTYSLNNNNNVNNNNNDDNNSLISDRCTRYNIKLVDRKEITPAET